MRHLSKILLCTLLLIWMIGFIISCGTTQSLLDSAEHDEYVEEVVSPYYTNPISHLVLDFQVSKESIIDSFEVVLDSLLSQPIYLAEYDVAYNLDRIDHCGIRIDDKLLTLDVPLGVTIVKKTMLGTAEAKGKLNISFESLLEVDRFWNLSTSTLVKSHEWIEKPKFKIGFISLPITKIINFAFDKTKGLMTEGIDKSLSENFDMREYAQIISGFLMSPYQLNETKGGWMYMTADSSFLKSATDYEHYVGSSFYVPLYMSVQTDYPDQINHQEIVPPSFHWKEDMPDSSSMRLLVDLRYDYLTELAKENFLNRTFKNGGKEVKVEDLQISGGDNRIIVNCQTSGSFNGNITISGRPVYQDYVLTADDIKWDLKTKNILHKAGTWIAKGFIHDQLNEMLTFNLDEYIEIAQGELENKLTELEKARDLKVDVEWGTIDINSIQSDRFKLTGLMEAKLKINVEINDLKKVSMF